MPAPSELDQLIIRRIRAGESDAWSELIERFEGRLLAFAESRLGRRDLAEDVVQETFIGFLNSLPNYDGRRSLESYLFAICAYKLTDQLRRDGRRPALPLSSGGETSSGPWEFEGPGRVASSLARSRERRDLEEEVIAETLGDAVCGWKKKGDFEKVKCAELLFVRGWANKDVAAELGLSEQQVANYKFDLIARLKRNVRKKGLSSDIFPELGEG